MAATPSRFSDLPRFLCNKLRFVKQMSACPQDVVRLHLGSPTFLVNNADDIAYVLQHTNDLYDKSPRISGATARDLFGDSLIAADAASHTARRKLLQPLFGTAQVARYADDIVTLTNAAMRRWRDRGVIDMREEFMQLPLRIIITATLGIQSDNDMNVLMRAVTARRRYIERILGSRIPYARYFSGPLRHDFAAAVSMLRSKVEQRLRNAEPQAAAKSFLARLMASRDGTTELSDAQICDEIITVLAAGHETLGPALAWAHWLLATHPETGRRVRREAIDIGGDGALTADHMRHLQYTRAVFDESMRLYPPTWLFLRFARRDHTLPSGATIPTGAKLYLSQVGIHHNPLYVDTPDTFNPERFHTPKRENRCPGSYFPFGGGPRACIGQHFAKLEAVLILATVTRAVRFEICDNTTPRAEGGITLRPAGPVRARVVDW